MSPTFSLTRVGKLIKKQLYENARLYTFSVLALFALLALVFTFWIIGSAPNHHEEGTYIIMVFGLFIGGTIFASMSFSMLGSKDKGIYWLSVPATHFEKLVCTIFFTTIVFTLVYFLCFYMVKIIAVSFLQQYIKSHPSSVYSEITNFNRGFPSMIRYFIYAYFAVQSLYLLGSVYFSRYAFIITTVAGAFLIFVFVYYITRLEHQLLTDANWDIISVSKPNSSNRDQYFLYSVSPFLSNLIKYVFQFAWAPLFWIVTWFRLKEKEI